VEQHPFVQEALKAQQQEFKEKVSYSRDQAISDLLKGIDIAKTRADAQALRACVQELNKIMGYHAPEKTETTVVLEDKAQKMRNIETASDTALLERLGPSGLVIEGEYVEEPSNAA
jgi:hypothetical protein